MNRFTDIMAGAVGVNFAMAAGWAEPGWYQVFVLALITLLAYGVQAAIYITRRR